MTTPTPTTCTAAPYVLDAAAWPPPTTASRAVAAFDLAVFVPTSLASVAVFALARKRYRRSAPRSPAVPFGFAIAVCALAATNDVPELAGAETVPCWVTSMLGMAAAAFASFSLLAQYVEMLLLNRMALMVSQYGRIELNDANEDAALDNAAAAPRSWLRRGLDKVRFAASAQMDVTALLMFEPVRVKPSDLKLTPAQRAQVVRNLKFMISTDGQLLGLANTNFFSLAVAAIACVFSNPATILAGCTWCRYPPGNAAYVITYGVVAGGLAALCWAKTRPIRDPWNLRSEAEGAIILTTAAFALWVAYMLAGPAQMNRSAVAFFMDFLLTACVVCKTWLPLYTASRAEAQDRAARNAGRTDGAKGAVVRALLEARQTKEAAPAATASSGKPKGRGRESNLGAKSSNSASESDGHQPGTVALPTSDADPLGGLAGGDGVLGAILSDPVLLEKFEAFLVHEMAGEHLEFILAVLQWKMGVGGGVDSAPVARLARARRLERVFLLPSSPMVINVSEAVLKGVRHALDEAQRTGAALPFEVFDVAAQECALILSHGPVTRFVKTDEYRAVVADAELYRVAVQPHGSTLGMGLGVGLQAAAGPASVAV